MRGEQAEVAAASRPSVRRAVTFGALVLSAVACAPGAFAQGDGAGVHFRRGDVVADSQIDLLDAFELLGYFFGGLAPLIDCDRAYDIDDDGALGIADAIRLLGYQFTEGAPPPAPFAECGPDSTPDRLDCADYSDCVQPPGPDQRAEIAHVLRRIAYGQTPDLFDRVLAMENGARDYVAEQLDPAAIDESANERLDERTAALEPSRSLDDLIRWQIHRGLYSERQLVEVLADFWDNHFNTDIHTVEAWFASRVAAEDAPIYDAAEALELAVHYEFLENETFRSGVLGGFHDLLHASATSVAMLIYLDSVSNVAGDANENYAREILELHTVGVDNGYDQTDIEQLARIFTGWTVCLVAEEDAGDPLAECQEPVADPAAEGLVWAFHFDASKHDYGEKLLFHALPESQRYIVEAGSEGDAMAGLEEGLGFLAHVAAMSQTAEYVSTKLVQKFVADVPPPELVASCLDAWLDGEGDIAAVLATLLSSDEFFAVGHRLAKVKTPMEFLLSTVRAFDGDVEAEASEIIEALGLLGHLPFHFETPDGFPETASDLLGTSRVFERLRFTTLVRRGDDGLEFPRIVDIMEQHDVVKNDPDAVARFWIERLFAGGWDEVDVALAAGYVLINANGDLQPLQPGANLYPSRIARLLAFLAAYPEQMQQ